MPKSHEIDQALIAHLGELARIQLDAAQTDQLRAKLEQLVQAFSSLAEADLTTTGAGHSDAPGPRTVRPDDLRPDTAESPPAVEEVLANAPQTAADCFVAKARRRPSSSPRSRASPSWASAASSATPSARTRRSWTCCTRRTLGAPSPRPGLQSPRRARRGRGRCLRARGWARGQGLGPAAPTAQPAPAGEGRPARAERRSSQVRSPPARVERRKAKVVEPARE